jgi:hypothetical protein
MKRDVKGAKDLKAHGVVFGLLREDGTVDVERTKEFGHNALRSPRRTRLIRSYLCRLVVLAAPMEVTFHRAFDWTRDALASLEDLISIGGIQRILTSGQQKSVLEGLPLIIELLKQTKGRIGILPGGGELSRSRTVPRRNDPCPYRYRYQPANIASDSAPHRPSARLSKFGRGPLFGICDDSNFVVQKPGGFVCSRNQRKRYREDNWRWRKDTKVDTSSFRRRGTVVSCS